MGKKKRDKGLDRLYSVAEASEETGMKTNQIMYAIKVKIIEPRKVGWIWALTEDEVETLREYKEEKDRKSEALKEYKKKK